MSLWLGMAEIDWNTILIAVMSFVILMLFLYVLRKPKTFSSMDTQLLLQRIDEVHQISENLKNQKCYNCGSPMLIEKLEDLFSQNIIFLKCSKNCGVTMEWRRGEGKGFKTPTWIMSGKTGAPREKSVIDEVKDKLPKPPEGKEKTN